MAEVARYVNTASTVGTQDGTTRTAGNSGTAAFATLRQAIDAIGATVSGYVGAGNYLAIYCEGSAADTGDVDQTPWDMTTTATEHLRIIGEQSPHHVASTPTGKWDTNKYRLTSTNKNALYNNSPAHLRIEGIQIQVTVNNAGSYVALKTANSNVTDGAVDYRVGYCIVKGVVTSGTLLGFESRPLGGGGAGTSKFYNCVAWNCTTGFDGEFVTTEVYNCTAYNSGVGFLSSAASGMKCVNCGADQNTNPQDFLDAGAFAAGTNYNSSSDATAPGSTVYTNQTFSFVDAANGDFHLQVTDTGAKDKGTTDPGSGLYSDDIDGNPRSGSWDIGADEYYVAPITDGPKFRVVTSPLRW